MAATLAAFLRSHQAEIVKPLLAAYGPGGGKGLGPGSFVEPAPASCGCHGHKSPVGGGLDLQIQQEVDKLLLKLDLGSFEDLPAEIQGAIETVAKDGAKLGAEQLSGEMSKEEFDKLVHLVNERAVAIAEDRAASLVGKKWVDGELVDNPNAAWRIDESTRTLIRGDVSQALQEGWTNDELAKSLMDSAAFSESRALMVARTELAKADMEANAASWKESGLVAEKIWLLAQEPCDVCTANAEQGAIPLEDAFSSEDTEPPAHPNCSCDLAPVVGD